MNSLEQALHRVINKTHKELLGKPQTLPEFDEDEISERIDSLGEAIDAGSEYRNNRLVKEALIHELQIKILSADSNADISLLQEELDEYLFQQNNEPLIEKHLAFKEKLQKYLDSFKEANTLISN